LQGTKVVHAKESLVILTTNVEEHGLSKCKVSYKLEMDKALQELRACVTQSQSLVQAYQNKNVEDDFLQKEMAHPYKKRKFLVYKTF